MPAEQHDFFNEGYVADTLSQIDTSTAIAQGKAVLDPGPPGLWDHYTQWRP